MGRDYELMECGYYCSCDGGGGLIPCRYPEIGDEPNPNCKNREFFDLHILCDKCGQCKYCEQCNCGE